MTIETAERPRIEPIRTPSFHYDQAVITAEDILERNRDNLNLTQAEEIPVLRQVLAQKLLEKDLHQFERSIPSIPFPSIFSPDPSRNLDIVTAIEEARDLAEEKAVHEVSFILKMEGKDPQSKEAKEALESTYEMAESILELEDNHKK